MDKTTDKMINDSPILRNKIFLYLTEFFSGMSVMAMELGASRLLAPYFSSSQIVWTIIIGTIMIAMAIGNVYGGKSADKHPDPDRLYRRVIIAAIWIAAIPVLGKYVIIGISGIVILSVNTYYLIWAALAVCLVIFVFPLFLLGTVTPSLAKYTVGSLEDSGKVIGTLGAFNTIGSIIGTFLPTFVTIPSVGTSITFLIFSGIMLALGIIYFISRHSGKKIVSISMVLFILCSVFGHNDSFAFWDKDLTYEGESVYNYLQVKDYDDRTVLSTNVLFGVQSVRMKTASLTGMYYDYAMAAPLMTDKDDTSDNSMLILGMGTGTYAAQCQSYYGIDDTEGVEIDQKITDLSRRYFDLPDDISVTTYDGRAYLQAVDKKYDVIMVDAYQDITIPFQMSSVEFFNLVKSHLNDGGVMIVNMNMRNSGNNGINQYLSDTISSVFDQVYTVDISDNSNQELFASSNPQMIDNLTQHIQTISDPDLKDMMSDTAINLQEYHAGGHIMTDDKAPVELLGMRAIDQIIGDQLIYYKEIYRTDGIRGLLDTLLE